jgi:hypothetical protein
VNPWRQDQITYAGEVVAYDGSTFQAVKDTARAPGGDDWVLIARGAEHLRRDGIASADPALLRASHIVPWADCTDEQRLDVHNGLLLSALWDAAFDCGLVSFADDGTPRASPKLSQIARTALGLDSAPPLRGLQEAHRTNLSLHRTRHGL